MARSCPFGVCDGSGMLVDDERRVATPCRCRGQIVGERRARGLSNTIPKKYRELIALAVACTTQCPYCIEAHAKGAKSAGATREEIVESSFLAAALRAGGAATHGAMALKFFDQD